MPNMFGGDQLDETYAPAFNKPSFKISEHTPMYFVIYQESESQYEPPYDHHDKGGYYSRDVAKYAFVDTAEGLFAYSKKKGVKYFMVEAQLYPTFTEKVIVKL
jgi:hypothetical protein